MSCIYCGNSNCNGACTFAAGQSIIQQGQYPNLGYQPFQLTVPYTAVDASLSNFLDIIADKTDVDACIAFMEQQKLAHTKLLQEIERLQKAYQSDLASAEQDFLTKCKKYRPSITSEILAKVKGLKAFF